MKGGAEKAMFSQSFPHTEQEEEEEEDALKEEEEEKSVSADPFVVVKLEDERDGPEAERSERSSGCGSALEISLFAPLESSEDGEEERPRPLTHTHPACWPCAPGRDEDVVSPQRRPRRRRKRPKRGRPRRHGPPAAVSGVKMIEETDDTDEPPDHAPPEKRARSTLWDFPSHKMPRSGVWEYFEYFINPEGELEDYGFPTCKLCQLKVACKRGNTSNMLRHLQEHHAFAYREAKRADGLWLDLDSSDSDMKVESDEQELADDWCGVGKKSEEENEGDDDGDADYSDHRVPAAPRRKRQVRSAVWQYFHYDKDRRPSCKICGWKLTAGSSGSTSNMRHHLQSQHQIVCPLTKSAGLVITLPEGDEPIKLYPPSTPRKSAVWKLFGFVMNNEGVLEENGFPICRLCHQVVASKDGNTSNMYSHLQHHHQAVYAELKHAMAPAGTEQRPDPSDATELHPPVKRRNSPVWRYFGFIKNAEGDLKEDGFPLCKMCHRRVAAKDGTTSNMLNHLRRHHQAEYEEVKLANETLPVIRTEEGNDLPELFPPSILPLSPVWDYFGYPKNADGMIEENERPKCKACRQSIVSKQGILSNMLRHLKFYHNSLYEELKSRTGWRRYRPYKERSRAPPIQANPDELYPPKMALKSGVWKHFGYLRNSKGMVVPDGFPICKLCLRKVSTPRGCTTNMMVHLQRYHSTEFAEMRLSGDDNDDQTPRQNGDPYPLFPPQDVLEPVWEHFGYPKDADGVIQVDGQPTCKICQVKVSCPGQSTKFLYRHLWKKHNAVYFDIKVATRSLRGEDGLVAPVLFPPTHRVKSAVWEYFGYLKDAEGTVVCDGFPICKICYLNVAAKGGNTTNMFKHLKDHHKSIYDEIRPGVPEEILPDHASSILHAPDGQNSKLWEYFGYLKNPDGVLVEDGAPACKICGVKVTSEGQSNMMKHLQENHEGVYAEVQEALKNPGTEGAPELPELHPPTQNAYPVWEYFGFLKDAEGSVVFDGFPICKICRQRVESKDGDTRNMFHHLKASHRNLYQHIKPAVEKRVYKSFELCPPNGRQIDIRLWDHFGYPKNAEGEVEEDGAPVCKICLQKLSTSSRGANLTTSMLRHLRRNHQSVYEEVQEAIGAWKPEWSNETLELYPPTQNVTSSVWEHFGYLKDAEGSVVCDGFPICKICHQKVPSKGGNTTNMFKHLKDGHRSIYSEIRSAVTSEVFEDVLSAADLNPPNSPCDPMLWEHFGYRKNADGVVEEDGAPFCKLCLRKLVSRGETTRNMKQHLKENHNTVYTEPEEVLSSFVLELDTGTSDLHPPTRKVKSAVWKYFGYPRDAAGLVLSDGFPICKLCQKKVSAKGGNTTNMFTHLRDYHRTTYNEIKATFDPVRTENELEPVELHLPMTDALSPVWKYFGYPKNADGSLVCDGYPLCKLCQLKVTAKGGSTTNMLMHLRAYHLDVYKDVKPAITKKSIYRPFDLYPPSGQDDIKLWDHFGYQKSTDGELKDDGAPICKICLRKMIKPPTGGTPTTNMLRHLRKKHQSVYNEVQEAITTLRTAWGIEPPELHPPTQNVTSAVWQYFGYLKDADGSVVCDDFPICKLCQQKVASKRRCTTNMFKHLKDYHRIMDREVNPFTIGGATELPELYPPEHRVRSGVWKYFGYLRDTEGPADCAGFPICKICLSKVSNKGKVTANMTAHLKDHHRSIYDDLKIPDRRPKAVSAENLPELHPPSKQPLSPIWKHFGLPKNADGVVEEDGCPICRICGKKVSSQDGRKMIRHLHFCHFSVYEELKNAIRASKLGVDAGGQPTDLHPPSKSVRSSVWEYFGYLKNPDGSINVDGRPICKMCFHKVSSHGGNTTNMFKHLEDKHGLSQ
ncbi:hypothetical protein AMELA_G00199060 [Ameiurus melas]|uniref:BED-type domain-containing protein n=1 Tax=Ameiurus melas TaxID=219545 RepID=A0A7J6A6R2_AMEME|nr:hypothetical protein AMELA_G00199060 [Ameiurus melas]